MARQVLVGERFIRGLVGELRCGRPRQEFEFSNLTCLLSVAWATNQCEVDRVVVVRGE